MNYNKIIDDIWNLSHENILSKEKVLSIIEDIMNSSNFGDVVNSTEQESIDNFFNMKEVGFFSDLPKQKKEAIEMLDYIYNDTSGKNDMCSVGEVLGIPVCEDSKHTWTMKFQGNGNLIYVEHGK